jgi:sirohydrochlorin ferrochelatase
LSSAYLLIFHGSRSPKTKLALRQLTQLVSEQLETNVILTQRNYLEQESFNSKKGNNIGNFSQKRSPLVGCTTLELAPLPLHQSIVQFAQQASTIGYQSLEILPLFLLPGIHVQGDLPEEIAQAKIAIGKQIFIKLHSYIGERSGMLQLLKQQFANLAGDGRILLAHGSRRQAANKACEELAVKLSAQAAYWKGNPSLREQVEMMIEAGQQKIAILPYFLFPGKLTAEISAQVQQLRQTFNSVEFILGEPLGATKELAQLVLEGII